jgi:hypothetical protein
MLHLLGEIVDCKEVSERHLRGAIEKREGHLGFRKMLPNKLQHQQLIEIGIKQGPSNRVQFPVVVVRPLSEVDDHRAVASSKMGSL